MVGVYAEERGHGLVPCVLLLLADTFGHGNWLQQQKTVVGAL